MLSDLTPDEYALQNAMSEISERAYYAGWMSNLEYVLWHAVLNGQQIYGRTEITNADIELLKLLSGRCQRWIYFDDVTEETAVNIDIWREKYEQWLSETRNF